MMLLSYIHSWTLLVAYDYHGEKNIRFLLPGGNPKLSPIASGHHRKEERV
jgi:hypothetical protein